MTLILGTSTWIYSSKYLFHGCISIMHNGALCVVEFGNFDHLQKIKLQVGHFLKRSIHTFAHHRISHRAVFYIARDFCPGHTSDYDSHAPYKVQYLGLTLFKTVSEHSGKIKIDKFRSDKVLGRVGKLARDSLCLPKQLFLDIDMYLINCIQRDLRLPDRPIKLTETVPVLTIGRNEGGGQDSDA